MRAFNVISVNLELRLAVCLGLLRQEQAIILLLGVGQLSILRNNDTATEHGARGIIELPINKIVE